MRIRNVPVRGSPWNRADLRSVVPFGGRQWPRTLNGFGSFGTASLYTGADCPVGPGASWEAWCDCVYPALQAGAEINTRCKSKPFPVGMVTPPWTEVGAGARGIPKPGSAVAAATAGLVSIAATILPPNIVQGPPPGAVTALPPVQSGVSSSSSGSIAAGGAGGATDEGIFGIPKTIAFVGGGVLLLGVAALAFSGKRRR